MESFLQFILSKWVQAEGLAGSKRPFGTQISPNNQKKKNNVEDNQNSKGMKWQGD